MSKVIKVTPVTVIKPPIEEEKPQEIIEVTPSLITSPDLPPTIDVESDIVNPIILSPIEMIQQLIDSQLEVISYEQFLSIIREVLVRFDTDPKRYKKEDYLKLILAIVACFRHLYKNDFSSWAVTEWSEELSDEKVPTEKLVKTALDAIDSKLTWISNNEENQKKIDFINVAGDLDYYNKCKESYPNAQIFYQDEKKWTIYANGLEYDFNSLPEFLDAKYRIAQLEQQISTVIKKELIKQVDLTVDKEQDSSKPVQIGIQSVKSDGTIIQGSPIYIEGYEGVGVKTDDKGTVLIGGTTYTLSSPAKTSTTESGSIQVETEMTSSGASSESSSSKFELKSTGPEVQLSQDSGVVSIDYTGVSSSKDWADSKETAPKKFGKIIGIHKIFNSYESILNSVFDGDGDISGVDENSIIYFISDSVDVYKAEFSNLRLKVGWGYIWSKGKLYNADLINLSQLYDDLIKTIQPTDNIFPSGFLKDKNWQELPHDCFKSALSSSGTYIVQIKYKQSIYSGILPYNEVAYEEIRDSYTEELTNKIEINTYDEIPLTQCGYSQDKERLYLKICKGSRPVENNISKPSLFIASSTGNGLIPSLFELKFKKLL